MFVQFLLCLLFFKVSGFNPRFQNDDVENECHCVLPQFCADDNAAITGQGLLDPRSGKTSCTKFREICCENPVSPQEIDIDEINIIQPILTDNSNSRICGIGTNNFQSRITRDSQETKFGELPWNAILLEGISYLCGGSLIHPEVVLTAAHCIFDVTATKISVRVGEWDAKSNKEPLPFQDAKVVTTAIHPEYNKMSLKNDVALLFLEKAFILAENVGVVCLPTTQNEVSQLNCLASGWGKDRFKNGKYSSILKKVHVPVVPREKCVTDLRGTRLGAMFSLHKSFICAGGQRNKDACKGDGGSPLICPLVKHKNQYVQMGIVSWGIGCGNEGVPGVYANVALFVDWIEEQMLSRSLDTSFYKF